MPDVPDRLYGPGPVGLGNASTLYTVPTLPRTFTFIRDCTVTNPSSVSLETRLSIGDMSNAFNRFYDVVVAANSIDSFRGLWVLNPGETIQGQQVTSTAPVWTLNSTVGAGAASSVTSTAWIPQADTLYFALVSNTKTDAPEAVSSQTGNGTFTQIATTTSGSVAAQSDIRSTLFYWYSTTLGSSATTVWNFNGVNQESSLVTLGSYSNVYKLSTVGGVYTTLPIIQSATNVDTVAPGATTAGLAATFSNPTTGGTVFYFSARNVNQTSTPPTNYTESVDGSIGVTLSHNVNFRTTLPETSTIIGPNTWSSSTTNLRTAIACELAPLNQTNVMLNGIEIVSS